MVTPTQGIVRAMKNTKVVGGFASDYFEEVDYHDSVVESVLCPHKFHITCIMRRIKAIRGTVKSWKCPVPECNSYHEHSAQILVRKRILYSVGVYPPPYNIIINRKYLFSLRFVFPVVCYESPKISERICFLFKGPANEGKTKIVSKHSSPAGSAGGQPTKKAKVASATSSKREKKQVSSFKASSQDEQKPNSHHIVAAPPPANYLWQKNAPIFLALVPTMDSMNKQQQYTEPNFIPEGTSNICEEAVQPTSWKMDDKAEVNETDEDNAVFETKGQVNTIKDDNPCYAEGVEERGPSRLNQTFSDGSSKREQQDDPYRFYNEKLNSDTQQQHVQPIKEEKGHGHSFVDDGEKPGPSRLAQLLNGDATTDDPQLTPFGHFTQTLNSERQLQQVNLMGEETGTKPDYMLSTPIPSPPWYGELTNEQKMDWGIIPEDFDPCHGFILGGENKENEPPTAVAPPPVNADNNLPENKNVNPAQDPFVDWSKYYDEYVREKQNEESICKPGETLTDFSVYDFL